MAWHDIRLWRVAWQEAAYAADIGVLRNACEMLKASVDDAQRDADDVLSMYACLCVCVRACVHACMCACVRVLVHA